MTKLQNANVTMVNFHLMCHIAMVKGRPIEVMQCMISSTEPKAAGPIYSFNGVSSFKFISSLGTIAYDDSNLAVWITILGVCVA